MRSHVVPAQITTVEDKIAGNLTMTQILLLVTGILAATGIYAGITPILKITYPKIIFIVVSLVISIILAFRIKGKVVFSWLVTILAYAKRPKYYVANKNEIYLRRMDMIQKKKHSAPNFTFSFGFQRRRKNVPSKRAPTKQEIEKILMNHPVRFRITQKGGLRVAFDEIN